MKLNWVPALVAIAGCLALQLRGQGTFQNVDLEAARIAQDQPPGAVSATNAFPGWNVFIGTNQQFQVFYNDPSAGSANISLLGTNAGLGFGSIEGGFSALLQAGVASGPGGLTQADVSIS